MLGEELPDVDVHGFCVCEFLTLEHQKYYFILNYCLIN
jgi:hypothetical protein